MSRLRKFAVYLGRWVLLEDVGEKNELGHTALDDIEHFCSYSGLTKERGSSEAFAT